MGCHAMDSWTFCGLVGAFLDLSIAYFLLCASTIAFVASNFLGFFGLYLPCPCDDGLFGNPNRKQCAQQKLFVDCPSQKISTVQLAVKSKFPFDSISTKHQNSHLNLRPIGEKCSSVGGFVEIEGGVALKSQNMVQKDLGVLGFEGKGIVNQRRPRSGGLRRRRNGGASCRKFSSIESSFGDVEGGGGDLQSPASVNKKEMTKGNIMLPPVVSVGGSFCNEKAPVDSHGFNLDEPLEGSKTAEKDASSVNNYKSNARGEPRLDCTEKSAIRFLERALEEEHAAKAALYLELEKERSAAATAADEAMAMIHRLQREKALIEMEARQYQRILEEKSVYDAEEMDILKEILLRREREKHFLEKEVEAYRQMIYLQNDLSYSVDPSEVPTRMPHIGKMQTARNGKAVPILEWDEDIVLSKEGNVDNVNSDFQEKEIVAMDACSQQRYGKVFESCPPLQEFSISREHNWFEKTQGMPTQTLGTYNRRETHVSLNCDEEKNKCTLGVEFETETRMHDVHVICDESNLCNEVGGNETELLTLRDTLNIQSTERTEAETKNERSSSEIIVGLPPIMRSTQCRKSLSDLRRNSTSSMDSEMLKIDTEVWRLRERLRTVQEGREKLNLSVEHQERKSIELQLLQDIASQLREIRQLKERGKTVRQASLPPPSTEVTSKKRRCHSLSLGVTRQSC